MRRDEEYLMVAEPTEEIESENAVVKAEIEKLKKAAKYTAVGSETAEEALYESEERVRLALAAAKAGMWISDLKGRWQTTPQINVFFGRPADAPPIRYDEFQSLIYDEDRERARQAWNRTIQSGEAYEEEYRIVRPDGSIRWLMSKGRIITLPSGAQRFLGISLDITDRKRIEEELRMSRDELELRVRERTEELRRQAELIEVAHDAIVVRNFDNQVTRWNRGAERMYGYTKEEALGANLSTLLKTEFPIPLQQIIEALRQKGYWEGELVRERKDGQKITVLSRWGLQKDEAGNDIAILDMSLEITERKRIEEQLRQAHKMEAIGTLAGGIAHDFNNMLAVIIGNAELALDDTDLTGIRQNLNQILYASKRSRDLIKQILTFSRKNGGQAKAVKIAPVLGETFNLLRASLPTTIEMKLNLRAKSDTIVQADASQIQQVVVNLANNAAYAMRDNGGELTIGLSTITGPNSLFSDKPGRYVKLTVRDTGSGIAPEVQRRMFEPFFTTKEQGQGTGMGLAVVYGIVNSCGGTIEVESEVGKGSRFTILLPQAEPFPVEEEEEEPGSICSQKEHILFVDDEPAVVQMATALLGRLDYRVTGVSDSFEALKMFNETPHQFDLVITDQTMPRMTGIALAQKLLAVKKDTPIILCTGHNEAAWSEKAKEIGIREFVMKPITKKEMVQAIRKVLDQDEEA